MTSPAAKIQAIYRYPVKGLTPEPLPRTTLAARQTIPCDRLYAIENGPSGFDPAAPGYLPKQRFLMLMRNARLAELRTRVRRGEPHADDPRRKPRGRARRPADAGGPRRDRAILRGFCADELRGPPKVLHARGPQLFRRGAEGGLDHQPRLGRGAGERGRRAGPSAALPRQSLCRGLAGLARVRSARTRRSPSGRSRAAEGRQAHRALRRDRGRPRHRHPRPADSADADETFRPCRLRRLCRGRSTGGEIAVGDAVAA